MAAASWRTIDGAAARTTHRTAQSCARSDRVARHAVESCPDRRHRAGRRAIVFVRSARRCDAVAGERRRHRVFASHRLSRWIEQKALTSERLTTIYLRRIEQFDPKLRCVITLTKDAALAQARQADAEIAAGHVSRAAARHSVRCEGSARHRRHPDDLWRGAVPEPRADAPTLRSSSGSTKPAPC